ncbi:hypothetical protein ABEY41_28030 [Peribacillus butanolivorans]
MVRRVLNEEDKRSSFLILTQKGMELRETLEPIVEGVHRKFVEGDQ